MANVLDVARYILSKAGPMTAMKLQKLVYYSHAWSLVWDEQSLIDDEIEAWANGPVVPALYHVHKGQFMVSTIPVTNPKTLTPKQRETIDSVLKFYGKKTAQQLSDLTHAEDPWKKARKGIPPGSRARRAISDESLYEYYSSL